MNISAIIPTYNRRALVSRAIESVLAQTVPVNEIIVVDDGSTDGTAEAVQSQFGPRVMVLRQANGGVSAARNHGIHAARGEWIAFLDSDDSWLPTKIALQLQALAACGDACGMCFTDSIYDGDADKKVSVFQETGIQSAARFGTIADPLAFLASGWNPFIAPTLLLRRSLLCEGRGFDEALFIGEDHDLIFRLSFKTKFCFVAEPLTRVDRDPSRGVGLCNLIASRDDRKYDSLQRLYAKWLATPELTGSAYQPRIRELLRRTYYSSTAAKIHDLRVGPAVRTIAGLRELGDSYSSIISTLVRNKVKKFRRSRVPA
jgi:glycosyltransferase involved in cell wall biosynthesis